MSSISVLLYDKVPKARGLQVKYFKKSQKKVLKIGDSLLSTDLGDDFLAHFIHVAGTKRCKSSASASQIGKRTIQISSRLATARRSTRVIPASNREMV